MFRSLSSILLISLLILTFMLCKVKSQSWIDPVTAMKTRIYGNFYVPNLPNINTIKIELWSNDTNPKRMEGDQLGGSSPYIDWTKFPDGKVDISDVAFINKYYGVREGDPNWDLEAYMADVHPDRKVDILDVSIASNNYGEINGHYSNNLNYIHVLWNTGEDTTPNQDGFISIPDGALSFTVYNGSQTVMAMITFWEEELIIKTWHNVSFEQFSLKTRKWTNVSLDEFLIKTRQWINVSFIEFLLKTCEWINVSFDQFLLKIREWIKIGNWILEMTVKFWKGITKWILDFKIELLIPVPIILFTVILIIGISIWFLYNGKMI